MAAASAAAAEDPPKVRFIVENDRFVPSDDNTDRYYTNGLRVEFAEKSAKPDGTFFPGIDNADWCRVACGHDPADGGYVTGVAIGQNMYTPERITEPLNQPDDRPWGGLLYVSRYATATFREGPGRERQDRIEATLGIVGPASQSGPLQIWWHKQWNWDHPAGWANQLRNEPVLQLQYATARRIQLDAGNHFDLIPRVRGNLGNMLVSAEAEATLRVGWNLRGFGVATPQPAAPAARSAPELDAAMALEGTARPRFLRSANLFFRANLKAVAHNIFLDGNTFARNNIRIARTPIVHEFAAGLELQFRGPLWLSYQYVHRGSEFRSRLFGKASAQNFGSIALSIGW